VKDVAYYRTLPFTRRVEIREDRPGEAYFIARVEELPGLRIDGATPDEALLKLDETFDDWIEAMLDAGEEIPEPERRPVAANSDAARPRGTTQALPLPERTARPLAPTDARARRSA
jgi:predicted RNase H-like HicB family nuclease